MVMGFENGKVISRKGVVPVVKDRLEWTFLNRTAEGWEPVPGNERPKVQFAAYGKPLTAEQLASLAEARSDE